MKRFLIAVAAVVALSSSAFAGGVDRLQVAEGAKWVAHLDVEALMASQVGQWALKQANKDGLQDKLPEFIKTFGFDPTKDIKSITVYGTEYDETSVVVLAQATMDQDTLLAALSKAEGYKTDKYGEVTVHQWIQDKGKDKGKTMFGCFYGKDIVMLAANEKQLKLAIDVLNGKAKGLGKDELPALAGAPKGTMTTHNIIPLAIVQLAARDFKLPADNKGADVVNKFTSLMVAIGEADGKLFASGSLVAKTDQDAADVRKMAEGALAFVDMFGDKVASAPDTEERAIQAEVVKLAKSIKIGGKDAEVTADAAFDVKTVLDIVEKGAALKKARQAEDLKLVPDKNGKDDSKPISEKDAK